MEDWNLVLMHTSSCHGESGGRGLFTQSFVYRALIGCSGAVIAGSIEIDTAFPAIVRCRSHPVMERAKSSL
jgi:hypothetical protein